MSYDSYDIALGQDETTGARLAADQVAEAQQLADESIPTAYSSEHAARRDVGRLRDALRLLLADRAHQDMRIAVLEAEHTVMRSLLQTLAETELSWRDNCEDEHCFWCRAYPEYANDARRSIRHTANCPVTLLRTLVAQWQPSAALDAPMRSITRYERTEDGGIADVQGGMLYDAQCAFSEAEWVALLALLNEGHDELTWEEIEPLVAERVQATTTPDAPATELAGDHEAHHE